jgi:renalase
MPRIDQKALRFAVIGAGIAGLSCASRLQAAGHQVTVLEKSRGTGGRMATRRTETWQCDHGAQYFTARSPQFRAALASWIAADAAALWSGRVTHLGTRPSHLPNTSADPVERFVGTPGMSSPARFMARTLDVMTECRVRSLQRLHHGWCLVDESGLLGTDMLFDHVILAMPAQQAAELLQPVASAMARLCQSHIMAPCWAVMLTMTQPLAVDFDAAFVNPEEHPEPAQTIPQPLSWVARDSSKPGRIGQECWLLHASAHWSRTNLELTADQVIEILVPAFSQLIEHPPECFDSAIISAHRWRFALPSATSKVTDSFLHEPKLGLSVCGDWLNGGRVEGAWLSGNNLAETLLAGLETND